MRALGNLLWHFPFFGFLSALYMFFWGAIFTVTIIGAPIGAGLFELGKLYLFPFGQTMTDASKLHTELSQNKVWRVWGWIALIFWLPFGVLAAIGLALQAFAACLTIIGIPVGVAAAKSIGTVFNPVGKKCISSDLHRELARRRASSQADAVQERATRSGPDAGRAQPSSITVAPRASAAALFDAPRVDTIETTPPADPLFDTHNTASTDTSDIFEDVPAAQTTPPVGVGDTMRSAPSQPYPSRPSSRSPVGLIVAVAAIAVLVGGGAAYYLVTSLSSARGPDSTLATVVENSPADITPFTPSDQLYASESGAPYRSMPSDDEASAVVARTSSGEELNVTGIAHLNGDDWYRVELPGGETAFVRSYLATAHRPDVDPGGEQPFDAFAAPGSIAAETPAAAPYDVVPYTSQAPLVIARPASRFRAAPFATPETPVLGMGEVGMPLIVTGLTSQIDGDWYQILLADGRTAYIRKDLTGEASLQDFRPATPPGSVIDIPLPAGSAATRSQSTAAIPAPAPERMLRSKPKPGRRFVPPVYPAMSRRLGEEGETTLAMCVDADGRASNVTVVKSSGSSRLDEAAVRGLTGNRLEPAVATDGLPIAMCDPPYQFTYVWDLP